VVKGNACYPPGGSLTVYNSAVTAKSVIILNYTDENSRGNTLAIISQANGSFFTSGSPNKCFQYVILRIATP
jgi:hypothetical protein